MIEEINTYSDYVIEDNWQGADLFLLPLLGTNFAAYVRNWCSKNTHLFVGKPCFYKRESQGRIPWILYDYIKFLQVIYGDV